MVIIPSDIARWRVRGPRRWSRATWRPKPKRVKISFHGFSVTRPHWFDEMFWKNEREREEWRARINRERSSQEDRDRERARLRERRRKWYWQCREAERARAQVRGRNTRSSRDEINVQPCKDSHNSSGDQQEKSNVFRTVFREITKQLTVEKMADSLIYQA